MLDGIERKGRCCVVALGIDTDGVKHPLGLWDGSTENATVATTLLANLTGRGLDVDQGVLVVLDGGKALRKAVNDVFGVHSPVQRCVRHKERDVLDHLPEHQRNTVRRRLRAARALDDHAAALDRLRVLADELARTDPGAAASLREGMHETLTVTHLGQLVALREVRIRAELDPALTVGAPRPRPPHRDATATERDLPPAWPCRTAVRSGACLPFVLHPSRKPLDAAVADLHVGIVNYGPHAVLLSSRTWFRRLSRSQPERTRREDRRPSTSTR